MNTFHVYLKGGQVVAVQTKTSYDETLLNIWDDTDERRILIVFEKSNISIVKSHISAIKDVTQIDKLKKDLAMTLNPDLIYYNAPKPYKPWKEQK